MVIPCLRSSPLLFIQWGALLASKYMHRCQILCVQLWMSARSSRNIITLVGGNRAIVFVVPVLFAGTVLKLEDGCT